MGTSVTNALVAAGHINKPEEFRRAFAAAVVDDFFEICSIAMLLPLQVAFNEVLGVDDLDLSLPQIRSARDSGRLRFLFVWLYRLWRSVLGRHCHIKRMPISPPLVRHKLNYVSAVGMLDAFSGMTLTAIASLMAWGLGYFGQPHILARFMAVRSSEDVPTACVVGIGWMVISLYGAVFTDFIAVGYYAGTPLANPETAFIALTQALFTPWVAACILAAVLAAIMSTVDSQLLVSSSSLTEDLYRAFLRKEAGGRELVWVGRGAVAVIALIAALIASDPESRVLTLVAYAWAGFGAGFGPAVILSLLWPRTTRNGVLAGMATGAVTVVAWANLKGGMFDVYEILPGCSSYAKNGASWFMSLSPPIRRRIGSPARSSRPFLGTRRPNTLFAIAMPPMGRCSSDGSEAWASGIALRHHARPGKTPMSNS